LPQLGESGLRYEVERLDGNGQDKRSEY